MDDITSHSEELLTADEFGSTETQPTKRSLLRIVGLLFVIIAVLLAIYGTITILAIQRGQALSLEYAQQDQAEQIIKQVNLARGDIENENFARAISRLDWVLDREPASPEALSLRADAQKGLDARLHPTSRPSPTATPESIETPETEPQPETTNQEAISDLEALMEVGNWAEAISAISNFQRDFPDERRGETDEMLYNAYLNLGVEMVSGTQIELGLFYLTQAEKLGDLPSEVQDQQTWAKLYLLGIGYYAVNWETAIFYFRGLCAAAPFYQDACRKLFEAYISFGDQYANGRDWCPAEEWYIEAIRFDNNESELIEKRREATMNCLEATPTPEAPITSTVPISNTLPAVSPTETITP